MSLQILIIVGAVLAVAFVCAAAEISPRARGEFLYAAADALLTPGELAFQRILNTIKPEGVCVNSKVRLADILKVDSNVNKSRHAGAFARIQSKHIDFVLCESASMKILCVIELHDTERRAKCDDFVREAFVAARVPYLEVKVSRAYNPNELRKRINNLLENESHKLAALS